MTSITVEPSAVTPGPAVASRPPLSRGPRARRWLRRHRPSGWHLLLIPLSVIMVVPLLWMLVTALSTLEDTRTFPPKLPSITGLQWRNFTDAWSQTALGHWMLNSTIVSVTCVISNLVLCSLAGYAFARMKFLGNKTVFFVILATLMIPFQVVMIPTLLITKDLHLVDSLGALIVPNLATAFGIYLLRQFFLGLPRELEEAALIDGAGRLRTLWQILLPLMGPPLSTVAILTFLNVWNDFLWPLIVLNSPGTWTVQYGLATFQSAHFTNWPQLMATTLISQLPMLILFVLGQRWFVRSIATTGIK
ncbi:MAG: carbohydrate ABC transporter permease [Actinomycetia bacterium]|nr:carbohydrate ABC transporter permease [Actinomycetes bacterium]